MATISSSCQEGPFDAVEEAGLGFLFLTPEVPSLLFSLDSLAICNSFKMKGICFYMESHCGMFMVHQRKIEAWHVLCDFRLTFVHGNVALDTHSLVTVMPHFLEVLKNRAFLTLAMFPSGISYINWSILTVK